MENRTPYHTHPENSNHPIDDCAILSSDEYVKVYRSDLEQEHTHLLGRIQQIRRLLGYTPLPTGKQMRREQAEGRTG